MWANSIPTWAGNVILLTESFLWLWESRKWLPTLEALIFKQILLLITEKCIEKSRENKDTDVSEWKVNLFCHHLIIICWRQSGYCWIIPKQKLVHLLNWCFQILLWIFFMLHVKPFGINCFDFSEQVKEPVSARIWKVCLIQLIKKSMMSFFWKVLLQTL